MNKGSYPAVVVLSLIALGLISWFGVLNVASGLGYWYRWSSGPLPLELMGRTVIYGVVPMLAMIDIVRRRKSGRYLGVLPLICSSALMFRVFADLVAAPLSLRSEGFPLVMPIFLLGLALAALGVRLGISKQADAYFVGEDSVVDSDLGIGHAFNVAGTVPGLDEGFLDRQADPTFQQKILEHLSLR